jgi:hypothetical protein
LNLEINYTLEQELALETLNINKFLLGYHISDSGAFEQHEPKDVTRGSSKERTGNLTMTGIKIDTRQT